MIERTSSLDDADRPHARHLLRQTRVVNDVDDIVHVLVRARLFLGQALLGLSASDDASGLQLLVDATTGGVLDGGGAAHGAAGAVTRGTERLLHAAGLTDQHPASASHVPGNDNRLTNLAIQ